MKYVYVLRTGLISLVKGQAEKSPFGNFFIEKEVVFGVLDYALKITVSWNFRLNIFCQVQAEKYTIDKPLFCKLIATKKV